MSRSPGCPIKLGDDEEDSGMTKKPAANAPCPCGSGKKFKKCCGEPSGQISNYFHTATMLENAGLTPTPDLKAGTAPWVLDPTSPCPCGSSKAYQNCCGPIIKAHMGSLVKDAAKRLGDGDAAGAASLYKAHLVQYLEWVYAHTLPFAKANIPVIHQIVDVDIEAITELSDTIAHCLYALGKEAEIPSFLQHVEAVVPLTGYEKPSAYLRALWLYIGLKDRDGATRELEKLGNILEYPRRQVWELYLDVVGSELSERQKITIADHIVADADEDEHVRVQYTVLKALALIQIGEAEAARQSLDALLGSLKPPSRIQSSDELSTEWQIGKAWSMYGEIYSDSDALRKAEESLQRIPETMLKPVGKAAHQRDLGWVLRGQARYCDAAAAFRHSLEHDDTQVGRIHLVHSLALCGNLDEAHSVLEGLDSTTVPLNLQLEYFGAQGSLAVASNNTALATKTVDGLRALRLETPFWEAQRNQLMVQMLDFVHRPDAIPRGKRQSAIMEIVVFMNEVLELKPNFFGLGLNLNKVIEKLTKKDQ